MTEIKAFELNLPRLSAAFSGIEWRVRKADLSRRKKNEIVVHIISDAVMKKINLKHRGKPGTTDVLSFSYAEGKTPLFPHEPVGEIYLSSQTAVKQARTVGTKLSEELSILTVHGALHVMGYDHETSAAALRKMLASEKRVLLKAGLPVTGLTDR